MSVHGPRIGITSTVPVEAIFAAGLVPVDLNNEFISSQDPRRLVEEAEGRGFPRSSCAWLKGIYSACRRLGINRIVGVVHGDCSGTGALLELLAAEGVDTVPFAYPIDRRPEDVRSSIEAFCAALGTDWGAAERCRRDLVPVRELLGSLDRAVLEGRPVSAARAHSWMVSSSDFRGDPGAFETELGAFLDGLAAAGPPSPALPVAVVGVPPIASDFFDRLEGLGMRVAYNEVPAEFTMMHSAHMSLEEIYCRYSYPYDSGYRLGRLAEEIDRRGVVAVIHYLQSFCHRQIGASLVREGLPVPLLALECDRPGKLDPAALARLESFAEMLRAGSDAK